MIHHLKRTTRHLIFWSLVALALSLTVVRLILLLALDSYKADLSTRVSEMVDAPVKIGRIRGNMRGYNPELVLKDIEILSSNPALHSGNDKPPIELKEIRMGINLLDMLIDRDWLAASWITLVGAKLTVKRKHDGSIAIVGLKASDEQPLWLLQGGKYEVLQSEVSWQDERSQGKTVVVGKVDFAILNKAQRHQMNILVKLPKRYGDELRVTMDVQGDLFVASAVEGAVYIEGNNIKPAEWIAGDLPLALNIRSGVGSFKIWSGLQKSQLVSLVADAKFQNLQLTRPEQGAFSVKQLNTRFYWEHHDNHWRLDMPLFALETVDKKWPAAAFGVSGDSFKDKSLQKLGLFIKSLDLLEASSLLHFFAPLTNEQSRFLDIARLKGALEKFSFFADLDKKTFAVNGKFSKISVAPSAELPGIENLSGQLKGSDQSGRLDLATKDARMTSSGLFRDPLKIEVLQGTLAWQQSPIAWLLSSPMIKLESPDLKTQSRVSLNIPKTKGQEVFLDMQTAFAMDDVSKVTYYLPVGTMQKSVIDWLDHAFINGRVSNGKLLFYGNLNDFPFTGGQGVFETQFEIDQMELVYNPDWPHLTELDGEVLFLQGGLQVDLYKGLSHKVKINQAKVTLPALGESEQLLVQGKLETEILQGLEFMQQTPLNSPVDRFLDAAEPFGNTQVTLDMKLPLADGAVTKVNGSAQLSNARLRVKALDLEVDQINGALQFNEQGVYSPEIKAAALNNPIQINIKSSDIQTTVNVTGRVGVSDLRNQFKIPGWEVVEGATDYQIKLQLPYQDKSPELLIQSKLEGVALDLPGTLAKTEGQQRPLSLTFNLVDQTLLPISLNYDNQLKAAIKFNAGQKRIESANILVGAGNVAQPQQAGIKLEINREPLFFQDWMGLASALTNGQNSESKTGSGYKLEEIHVHSEHGLWKNANLGFIDLLLKSEGKFLTGAINSSFAKGKIKIPVDLNGIDSIFLAMDELDLTTLKQLQDQSEGIKPEPVVDVMPLITVSSQKTLWQSLDLGQLNMETDRIPNGIAFKRIELSGIDQRLLLSGDWRVNGNKSETRIQGNLNMPQAGQFLSKLGITKDLTETSAVVNLTGEWDAAPYQFSLTDLQGQLDVNFNNGRILGIEPGFGRVLGILAITQWIKRFQLDFSDIFDEGLTFISIKGHFNLLNGKATTNDLVVDSIPAKISLTGNTDLINETVDYGVSVVPKSADAVPIAGTIMGKVADLVGRTLTGKDQQGFFFGSQYLVKGKWRDAKIIPLHENDGLLQKTWSGISGFPWLEQTKEP